MQHYPAEFLKPLNMAFNLLCRSNITYFSDNVPGYKKYWRLFYIVPCIVVHFFFETLYVVSLFLNHAPTSEMTWMIPVYLILVQGIIKAVIAWTKKMEIEILVSGLVEIWRTDGELTTIQIEQKQYRLKSFNFCLTLFYWGSMLASYQNLFTTIGTTLFKKIILQQEPELQFAFGNAYPYDFTTNWFLYLSVYFFQCFSMLRFIYVYLGTECLMMILCSQLSTTFALLREDLNLVLTKNKRENKGRYNASDKSTEIFVKNHQKLVNLVNVMNTIFNQLVCSDFVFATVLICFFCFAASVAEETTEFLRNISAVLALLGPISILCYYAEQLQEESVGVANAAYETSWYDADTAFQKSIFLIILRSQKACCLTSLNYAPISLNSFTKIISTSYSYYSLVRTMYADK